MLSLFHVPIDHLYVLETCLFHMNAFANLLGAVDEQLWGVGG